MTVPQTAFSLLYNATRVSAYRREAHEDLRASFERFGVTDGEIQEACTRIENAAYELRVSSTTPGADRPDPTFERRFRAARRELDQATDLFLTLLEPEVAWLLLNFAGLPPNARAAYSDSPHLDPSKLSDALLLDVVYHYLYVPEFPAQAARTADFSALPAAIQEALQTIGIAKAGPAPSAESARQCASVLCTAIASEYKKEGWLACW